MVSYCKYIIIFGSVGYILKYTNTLINIIKGGRKLKANRHMRYVKMVLTYNGDSFVRNQEYPLDVPAALFEHAVLYPDHFRI